MYHNTQDPNTKATINKLQKEIRTKIYQESIISWEKFRNPISLESGPKKSWCKITNFLKPKGPCSYPMLNPICQGLFLNRQSLGGGGGSHHNFVVIAPMIMKFGTGIKLDVFSTMVTKSL